MKKSILSMLEEEEKRILAEAAAAKEDADIAPEPEMDDDEEEKDEKISDHAPDGKGHYTADDLREIIDYVRDLLKEEEKEEDDEEDDKDSGVGEVGLDLIYEYADLMPETVINQIVDDLKDMFEIEDTMLESIVTEGASFFNKSKKGPAAIAARKKMLEYYKQNKSKIMKRNSKWRNSLIGKKMSDLHKKIYKGMGKIKGKRVVSQL